MFKDFIGKIKERANKIAFQIQDILDGSTYYLDKKPSGNVSSPVQTPAPTPSPTPSPTPASYGRLYKDRPITPPSEVVNAIIQASEKFNVPSELLFDIANQESSFNPKANPYYEGRGEEYAKAGYPKGLFQITDPLWKEVVSSSGSMGKSVRDLLPPQPSVFDPYVNALIAAYLISFGQLGRWNASQPVWGKYYKYGEVEPYYQQTLPANIPTKGWME